LIAAGAVALTFAVAPLGLNGRALAGSSQKRRFSGYAVQFDYRAERSWHGIGIAWTERPDRGRDDISEKRTKSAGRDSRPGKLSHDRSADG
jgi:hypothetical protein